MLEVWKYLLPFASLLQWGGVYIARIRAAKPFLAIWLHSMPGVTQTCLGRCSPPEPCMLLLGLDIAHEHHKLQQGSP